MLVVPASAAMPVSLAMTPPGAKKPMWSRQLARSSPATADM